MIRSISRKRVDLRAILEPLYFARLHDHPGITINPINLCIKVCKFILILVLFLIIFLE